MEEGREETTRGRKERKEIVAGGEKKLQRRRGKDMERGREGNTALAGEIGRYLLMKVRERTAGKTAGWERWAERGARIDSGRRIVKLMKWRKLGGSEGSKANDGMGGRDGPEEGRLVKLIKMKKLEGIGRIKAEGSVISLYT